MATLADTQSIYKLRNTPAIHFTVDVQVLGPDASGATVRASIKRNDGLRFRYEVVFSPEYCGSKPRFDADSYRETALSVINSQLESHVHRDTRIELRVNSGMPRTQVDCKLDWPF